LQIVPKLALIYLLQIFLESLDQKDDESLSSCMAAFDEKHTTTDPFGGANGSVGELSSSLGLSEFPAKQIRRTESVVSANPSRRLPKQIGTSVHDPLLHGFIGSASICHVERRQLGLRLRARSVAVESALAGEGRSTLPDIAVQVGTSTRTLNTQFGIRDALFAFPPPELVPVLVDCWVSTGDAPGMRQALEMAFRKLDENPVARSLLIGLARLHTDLPKLALSDGYFNSALRSQLVAHPAIPSSCLRWTGYLTDALRDSLQEWTVSGKESIPSLESIVPNLMERLRPIAFV
jgi:hypothetical protein